MNSESAPLHRQQITTNAPVTPRVSIGMPVYNGEAFVGEALDSLLVQSFTDFELIISDNHSTDGTEDICRKYARKDERIVYVRQPDNRGPAANFQFVLDEAIGEFFMWAPADDVWEPDFILKNFLALSLNDNFIGSIGRVKFVDNGNKSFESSADSPLTGSLPSRINRFLSNPSDNSRFYSLYRRAALKDLRIDKRHFHAADWFFVAEILLRGELNAIDEVLMKRRAAPRSRYLDAERIDNINYVTFGFPLLPLTIELLRKLPVLVLIRSFPALIKLNLKYWWQYNAKIS